MNRPKTLADLLDGTYLPKTVTVAGISYPIRWDFSTALRFMEYVDTSRDDDETFLKTVLEIWYPKVPEDTDEALTQVIRFYCGGDLPGEGYYTPLFPPSEDCTPLYGEFTRQFGIDLQRDPVHWWVFRRLLGLWKERSRTL